MIRFGDCNYPGVIYSGTEAHMNGLAREGGSPYLVQGSAPIPDEDMAGGFWDEREAPSSWALSDEEYDSL